MINVFIIHSSTDKGIVDKDVIKYLEALDINEDGVKECNVLRLGSGNEEKEEGGNESDNRGDNKGQREKRYNWKKEAGEKIKMAHAVIVVLGDDSNDKCKEATMGWEARRAIKLNKLIMIYNPKHVAIPEYLRVEDRFNNNQKNPVASNMSLEDIRKRLHDYIKGAYPIFSSEYAALDEDAQLSRKNEIVDQYKMFQKTSEDLVARRQSVNSFYISVNSALTGLLGVALGVFDSSVKMIVVAFMCIAGVILDVSWINILEAYGTLNAAKLKVIRLLEEKLPITLYDTEWLIMSDKLNNKKYVSFTDSEKRIPKLFLCLYVIILVGVGVYTVYTFLK